jgi:hypothetical protein
MIRSFPVYLALFLWLGPSGLLPCRADDLPNLPPSLLDSVVIVIAYKDAKVRTGTGFIFNDQIEGRLTVITNDHVVSGAESVFVRFRNESEPLLCEFVDSRPGLDLAALRVKGKPKNAPPVIVAADPGFVLALLQNVLLIGQMVFKDGEGGLKLPWSAHEGKVSAVERNRNEIVKAGPNEAGAKVFQLNLTTAHGMSGSPILNADKKLVGVLFAGVDFGVSEISFGVPHAYLGRLKLNNAAKPFTGQGAAPVARAGGGVRMLNAVEPMMPLMQTPKGVDDKTAYQMAVGAINWGPVPNDTRLVFNRFVTDRERFEQHVPEPILKEMLQRHRVFHVTNPVFHFSVLVPDIYHMKEIVPRDRSDILITTFECPNHPQPLGRVKIETQKIPLPTPGADNLKDELNKRAREFLRFHMAMKLDHVEDPPGLPLPFETIKLVEDLSDREPRVTANGRAIRFWRRYRSITQPDRDYAFMYGIIDDVFVVGHFAISPSRAANITNADLVERFMILSSLSFSE